MISAATFNHIQVLLAEMLEQDKALDNNPLNASANKRWNEIFSEFNGMDEYVIDSKKYLQEYLQ